MAYNPKHCTILIVNRDGSGQVFQYETLLEAKEAYNQISEEGERSVYLYPPAIKSISYNESDSSPPISNTSEDVVDGDITRKSIEFAKEDNSGSIRRNPFDYIEQKTFLSCSTRPVFDAKGTQWNSSGTPLFKVELMSVFAPTGEPVEEYLQDGDIFEVPNCDIPVGLSLIPYSSLNMVDEGFSNAWYKIRAVASELGGGIAEVYKIRLNAGGLRPFMVYQGNKEFTGQYSYGIKFRVKTEDSINVIKTEDEKIIVEDKNYVKTVFKPWESGSVAYKDEIGSEFFGSYDDENAAICGFPFSNGSYSVLYWKNGIDLSDGLASGNWSFKMAAVGEFSCTFIPDDPEMEPPPQDSILKLVEDPNNAGESIYVYGTPDIHIPTRIEEVCGDPVTATIEGTVVTLGERKKKGLYDGVSQNYWGTCRIHYVPAGILVHETESFYYYSDGNGGYTSQSKGGENCDPQGQLISETETGEITVTINDTQYVVGTTYERVRADGNCGQTTSTETDYVPDMTLLVEYDGNNYYSDGVGGYKVYPIAGTITGSSSEAIYVDIIEDSIGQTQIGTRSVTNYADGQGGSYSEYGENEYYSYGYQIASEGNYNYFSNGVGGYYAEEIVNPPCDSAGTLISEGSSNVTVYINELLSDFVVGTRPSAEYADGNCGSYTEFTGDAVYFEYGFQIASDSNYNYLSNGVGGYFAEPVSPPCDSAGTVISTQSENVEIYINELSINAVAGTVETTTFADGNCGSYTEPTGTTVWYTYGTQIASDSSYNYLSNGSGGYYSEPVAPPPCDEAGTVISTETTPNTIYIAELYNTFNNGTSYTNIVADGSCGTLTESGSNYEPDGYEFFRDATYSYVSDGIGGYRLGYPYDGEYNYPIDDDSAEDIGVQNDGVGAGEANFYDENGVPYVYDSYDIETGDVLFAAGAPEPEHGAWFRNSFGHIAYTSRNPRFTMTEIPNGWRSTNAYWVNNSVAELKGATSLQVQVGWTYQGRKRWHSEHKRWLSDSFFPNSENEGGTTANDGAIIPNNVICSLPTLSAAGPKTFYEATPNPNGTPSSNPFLFTPHNNYWAVSNGDGTARFEIR